MSEPPPYDGSPVSTRGDLSMTWDRFREGSPVHCGKDEAPLALEVDAAAGIYRFVCTRCGNASPWFESGQAGLRVRSVTGAPQNLEGTEPT